MNTQEYIDSGILEAYALGSLSAGEAAGVEANIARYPELAAELRAIEDAMEQMAFKMAKQPPAALQDKIWDSIQQASALQPHANGTEEKPRPTSTTIPFHPEYRKAPTWRYAALWAAIIGSTVLNVVLFTQSKNERTERVALNEQMAKLRADQQQLASTLGQYHKAKDMMADTAMQTIVMHTVVQGHPMAATVYWSKANGAAYVAMNALPKPAPGMQYQMWVIQNGKPVSMGVLPADMANTPDMQKIDMSVMNAEAFAISLEKEGGNPTPTTVYVVGKA